MEGIDLAQTERKGLSERVLREILRTPPLKEAIILLIKDIDADAASGLVKALLWEDAAVSMSLMGAFPDMLNWLLALLLELGRQLNNIPESLLKELLGKIGSGIDLERLKEFPGVYSQLGKRILIGGDGTAEDAGYLVARTANAVLAAADRLGSGLDDTPEETARVLARSLDGLDTASLGKILNRFLVLGNAVRRSRRVPFKSRISSLLSQMDAGELFSMLGGLLKNVASGVWALLASRVRMSRT